MKEQRKFALLSLLWSINTVVSNILIFQTMVKAAPHHSQSYRILAVKIEEIINTVQISCFNICLDKRKQSNSIQRLNDLIKIWLSIELLGHSSPFIFNLSAMISKSIVEYNPDINVRL